MDKEIVFEEKENLDTNSMKVWNKPSLNVLPSESTENGLAFNPDGSGYS